MISDIYTNFTELAKSCSPSGEMKHLPDGFKPGPNDVLACRGRTAFNHNKHFRELIEKNLEAYSRAGSKLEKSLIVSNIVDTIRAGSPNGGFVRCVKGQWQTVSESVAREKVGGAFREMLHTQYKSSAKAKKRRRQEQEAKEGKSGTPEPYASKRRCVTPVSSQSPSPMPIPSAQSPNTNKAVADLLKEITERKQALAKYTTDFPMLEPKLPMLPPPARFPSAPKLAVVPRGASTDSIVSFDLKEMQEVDEFDLALTRFTSVATTDIGLARFTSDLEDLPRLTSADLMGSEFSMHTRLASDLPRSTSMSTADFSTV